MREQELCVINSCIANASVSSKTLIYIYLFNRLSFKDDKEEEADKPPPNKIRKVEEAS